MSLRLSNSKKIVLTLGLFLILFPACTQNQHSRQTEVVLRVNDAEMTAQDFARILGKRLRRLDALAAKNPENLRVAREAILQEFILEGLTSAWATENKISISQEEWGAEVDRVRAQYPNDLAFKEALAAEGTSFDEWKASVRKSLLQRKVSEKLKANINRPSEAEMRSYFEANRPEFNTKAMIRIRQVVLEKQDDAERLVAMIKQGTSLADLAKKFSITPEASNGGDTGWIAKGTLDIFDSAFSMPIGKRSSVLKSPYGFHILEVIGKKEATQLNFDQARPTIERTMLADREQALHSAWLESQVKKAHVYRNDVLLNSVSVLTRGDR